jgi:4-amino-4-deoxy-L-arabinose transferase-like glycosyltransferase
MFLGYLKSLNKINPDMNLPSLKYITTRINHQPPLLYVITFPFTRIFGTSEIALIGVEWIFAIAFIVSIFYLAKISSGSDIIGFSVAMIFLFMPTFLLHTQVLLCDVLLGFFMSMVMIFLVKASKSEQKIHFIFAGLFYTACLLIKFTVGYFIFPAFVFVLILFPGPKRLGNLIAFLLPSLVILFCCRFLLKYDYIVNVWTGFAALAGDKKLNPWSITEKLINPVLAMSYLGIPALYLIATGILRELCMGITNKNRIFNAWCIISFLLFFAIFSTSSLGRHQLGIVPLLVVPLALELQKQEFSRLFFMSIILVEVMQTVIFKVM